MRNDVVVVGAARTPIGGFQGALMGRKAAELGGVAIQSALARAGLDPSEVDEVLMGCVLTAGQGQAPARQAALSAGLPVSTPASTINKMCGSGMKTVMMACDSIRAGEARTLVAGGMESMSNAPYLLDKARGGYRMGHGRVVDHMFLDGLEDAYESGRLMGTFAEDCAEAYQFTREAQDAYALQSLSRAQAAISEGRFGNEIAPVTVSGKAGAATIDTDEQPGHARPDKIPMLKPAFRPQGTVTAANSSSISDGAAALVLMSLEEAERRGLSPLARIVAQTAYASEPRLFPTAPIGAMQRLFQRCGWSADEVDLYEINEAFAVVPMAAMRELALPPEKVNINGGACALGHPIGASGARILVTLLSALQMAGGRRGVASVCIGGGEATAIALERLD